MEALFLGDSSRVTALDVFDYYYRRAMHSELYEYFAFRFAQPRYLGAVSLATLLPSSGRPTLDLACGFGHLLHYLTSTHPGRLFIGADRNFFQLYAAKRWIAPDAEFICADADQRLPFVSGSFGGVLCSDAFHYFPRKTQCVAELRRVVEERGVFVVARAGNARVEWKEGFELPPEGYRDLFSGLPFRIVSERALVRAYRTRMGPPLAAQPPLESLEDEKWLSFVATRREELFRDHPALTTWPHGVGRLRLNPLYRRLREDAAGKVLLELEVPRGRYPLEHPDGRVGLPERVEVGAGILREIAAGERTPSVEELIANLVVLGVPTNYG
jgi:SAM-dependent methyltransferase